MLESKARTAALGFSESFASDLLTSGVGLATTAPEIYGVLRSSENGVNTTSVAIATMTKIGQYFIP
jgi:hypothetical protein